MRRFLKTTLILLTWMLAQACASMRPPSPTLTWLSPPAEFRTRLRNVNVLQLGEGIHLTREFPLARLDILKSLVSDLHYDVLAFEGSPVDFWIAMDEALQRPHPEDAARKVQKLALFGLWQTLEMREVIHFALSTLSTPAPVYLTSFDAQPGMGRAFMQNPRTLFSKLYERLAFYEGRSASARDAQTIARLSKLQGCLRTGFPASAREATLAQIAIADLKRKINKIYNSVDARYPQLPHAAALSSLPASLERSLALCQAHRNRPVKEDGLKTYQETRDALNAQAVQQIQLSLSHSGRIVLWAHHSHTHYNALQQHRISLGQNLKRHYGTRIYSIGTFAGSGEVYSADDSRELAPVALAPEAELPLEHALAQIEARDYFMDLRDGPALNQPLKSRHDAEGSWILTPNEDFDGVIFVHAVHPPTLDLR